MTEQPNSPLRDAVAAALAAHGVTDPAAAQAAADTAARILGHDRCTCRAATHRQHHHDPVDGCPWCRTSIPATPARSRGTEVVTADGDLL